MALNQFFTYFTYLLTNTLLSTLSYDIHEVIRVTYEYMLLRAGLFARQTTIFRLLRRRFLGLRHARGDTHVAPIRVKLGAEESAIYM